MTEKTAPSVIRIERLEDAGQMIQDTFNAGDLDGLVSLFEPRGSACSGARAGGRRFRCNSGNFYWFPGDLGTI